MKKRTMRGISTGMMVWLLCAGLMAGGASAQAAERPRSMSILDGRTASSVYAFATGMAELITKYTGIKTIPSASTYGKNLILVHGKEAEFCMTNNDRAYFGARGQEDYKDYGKMNIRLLFSSSVSAPFVFVTRRDANLKSLADLKGKKVMCIQPGNPTFTKGADLLFEAAGMSRTDVQALSFAGHDEGNMALKERRISAYIQPVTTTSVMPFVQELNYEVALRLLSGPGNKLDAILSKNPYFRKDTLPGKIYGEMTDNADLTSIGISEIVVCQGTLSDDLVYSAMKAIFDHLQELYPFTPISRVWTTDPVTSAAVLPYHSGAVRYYREKKMWTETVENKHKQLLSELGFSK